ncbi:MAG: hypothetical protein U5K73_08475 [Halofilum sp. (in: g-proteobacteria)]|nr:hypothetical protein [Halofilum sp. (in: g-proteobacteria)]
MTEEEIERRLWVLNRTLGGSTPMPGLEGPHRHAEIAACHFAAYRHLQAWGDSTAAERRAQARDEIEAAQQAYASAEVTLDGLGDELIAIAHALQEVAP